jgi:molecular chaperone GrpE
MADENTVAAAQDRDESDGDEPTELKARVIELEDLWRRALADLDNTRKRATRDLAQVRADERTRVAAEWLPILDNLELALAHAQSDPTVIVQGIQAVRDQALAVLTRLGFPRRNDVGEQFDPARHEAVSAVADPDAEPGTILHVVRPGYGDDEHPLRPAAVVVAQRPD